MQDPHSSVAALMALSFAIKILGGSSRPSPTRPWCFCESSVSSADMGSRFLGVVESRIVCDGVRP